MWLQLFGGGLPCQLGHLESSKKTVEPAQNIRVLTSITLKHFYTLSLTKVLCFFLFKYVVCSKVFSFFLVDHLRQYGNSLYQNWLKVEQVYVGDLFSTYHLKMHYDSTLSAGLTKYIHSSRNDQG